MKIRWLGDSIEDLIALRQYIAKENPLAAKRVATKIIQSVNFLLEQPGIGRAGRVPNSSLLLIGLKVILLKYCASYIVQCNGQKNFKNNK